MTTKSKDHMCQLTCQAFVCSKRMLQIVNKNGKKSFFCKLDDAECLGYMCNYAECRERKLNDSGNCLRPIKTQQQSQVKQVKLIPYQLDYMTPNDLDEKFRKKISRKLK
ncbi:MAG: hypothetical protein HGN29_03680 [Asgard group archaeon]|nr:hypothetical protein [Asgard group archaeon]